MKILYFARLRQLAGRSTEEVDVPADVATADALMDFLAARDPGLAAVFADRRTIRVAIDQQHSRPDASTSAREVAFFPPVTGGLWFISTRRTGRRTGTPVFLKSSKSGCPSVGAEGLAELVAVHHPAALAGAIVILEFEGSIGVVGDKAVAVGAGVLEGLADDGRIDLGAGEVPDRLGLRLARAGLSAADDPTPLLDPLVQAASAIAPVHVLAANVHARFPAPEGRVPQLALSSSDLPGAVDRPGRDVPAVDSGGWNRAARRVPVPR
ncbi:MAG: molybdopterin converting factor subunit 1 [Hyphomicrobiales bacterium]